MARSHFTAHRLNEALRVLPNTTDTPVLFLRHDIKVSLSKALRMAEIEHESGVPATYMVRGDSPLYSLVGRQARVHLMEFIQMGHEVGLHFDLAHETRRCTSYRRLVESEIHTSCERIEQIICRPVRSVSFQRALPLLFGGSLLINGRINADAGELRRWCLSESGGDWHKMHPLTQLASPAGPVLQLIIHPIWWGEEHTRAPQRLQEFFEAATREKAVQEACIFDINLAKMIPAVRRQGVSSLSVGEGYA